jgi:hypothetical protein
VTRHDRPADAYRDRTRPQWCGMPATEPRCRSTPPTCNAIRSRRGGRRHRGAKPLVAGSARRPIAFHSHAPTKAQRQAPTSLYHYPHSAQHPAPSFNPASVRSHSRRAPGPFSPRDLTEPSRFPKRAKRDSCLPPGGGRRGWRMERLFAFG